MYVMRRVVFCGDDVVFCVVEVVRRLAVSVGSFVEDDGRTDNGKRRG